jgi:hypothetical protein
MKNISKYNKFYVAIVGATLTWITVALADDKVTTQEWVGLAVAVATALGVYQIPNQEK